MFTINTTYALIMISLFGGTITSMIATTINVPFYCTNYFSPYG